ncbi:hypothetical protein [Nocardiopsis algeriensis]|uniref:Uncharacterized protein (TIGR04222 family) n=1 Tax=Nocardiopsis algeriensis TaxID=1478215 RepID=A0A841IP88_9ACTN|nr:hypothetical protein [Nocardiopsis algeriensis]MBB6120649.1 uncharacterized protein (TIGR04222 family) [Nocardiopsis algeriensis]
MDLILPLLWGPAIAYMVVHPLIAALRRSRAALEAGTADTPPPRDIPRPEELEPAQLGYLVGGPARAAEVALADAFLARRVRIDRDKGTIGLVGTSLCYTREKKDPLRRALVAFFRKRGSEAGAGTVVAALVRGQGMLKVWEGLAAAGLVADSPALRTALAARARVPGRIRTRRLLAAAAIAAGGGLHLFAGPGAVSTGILVAGAAVLGLLEVVRAVMRSTGGPTPVPLTPAGRTVAEAAQGLVLPEAGTDLESGEALRHVAVSGFGELRRHARAEAPPARRGRGRDLDGSDSGGVTGLDAPATTDRIDLDSLGELADLCRRSGPGVGEGGIPGSDGWGGPAEGSGSGGLGDGGGGGDSGGGGGGE